MTWKAFGILVCVLLFSACGDEAECKWSDSRPCGVWPCEGEQRCNAETKTWGECSSIDEPCGDCCVCVEDDGEVQPHEARNTGAVEDCDEQDNDCDGSTDEGCGCSPFSLGDSMRCGTTDRGECRYGVQICVQDPRPGPPITYSWSDCIGVVEPAEDICDGLDNDCDDQTDNASETCNGEDDDCDGYTDEDFTCRAGSTISCTTSCGSEGSGLCSSFCTEVLYCLPPPETCNGRDDDCDGVADEDFGCVAGEAGSCTVVCGSVGSRTCDSSCNWDTCTPPTEICNGYDDDCDGSVDEGFGCAAGRSEGCAASCGTAGWRLCSPSCSWGVCTPPPETCNARDDDCDGSIDEDFACRQGSTGTCTTSCSSTGSRGCSSSCAWGACVPPAESCGNGRDDDCDGSTDEGCCVDADRDGHFARAISCPTGDDCNDSNAAIYPGATEVCDSLDNNCDGTTDVIAPRTVANVTTTYEVGCTMGDGCCDSSSIGIVQNTALDASWFSGMARTRITASVDYAYYARDCPPTPNAEVALVTVVGGTSYRQSRTFGCEVQQAVCGATTPWGSFSYTWTFSSGTLPSQTYLEVVRDGYYGVKYRNWRVTVEVDCY